MFGTRLKELRKEKKLTQFELADSLHLGRSTITRWESDNNEPDLKTLVLLANFFNVSLDYLLGESDIREEIQEFDKDAIEITRILNREDDLKLLFSKTKDLDKENLQTIARIIDAYLPKKDEDL